jgi:hypoxia up-regulated 1
MEKPIIHRYQEIEAFPQVLNNSQMWNWSTRLFLQEARQNLSAETAASLPSKWTKEELDGLEKTLREHESWLSEWVEKQKSVKANQDPVIETTEMKARAKVLETHLHKLWKRKVPKKKPVSTSSSTVTSTTTSSAAAKATVADGDDETREDSVEGEIDGLEEDGEQQIPMMEEGTRPPKHVHEEL